MDVHAQRRRRQRQRKLHTTDDIDGTHPPPLVVTRQSGDFVEFRMHNTTWFDDDNDGEIEKPQHIFASFAVDTFASEHCKLYQNLVLASPSAPATTTTDVMKASCMNTATVGRGKVAYVQTFVRYNTAASTNSASTIPKCCMDPFASTATATAKVVEYVFEIDCDVSCENPVVYKDPILSVAPTSTKTAAPTVADTVAKTDAPTKSPTASPTVAKTDPPTKTPTASPTVTDSDAPTRTITVAPTVASDAPSAFPSVDLFVPTDSPTVPITKAATCPTTKPISPLSRDLVVGSQLNGPHFGSRHPWAWPKASNRECGRFAGVDTTGTGAYAWPCYVKPQFNDRVLNFDSAYMNFQFAFDKGMEATITLSDEAVPAASSTTSVSFFPSGGSATTACKPPTVGSWSNYPIRLVRSGRYLHHWYFEEVNCNGAQGDTRVEMKVTPDCVELYSVSNQGAQTMSWLDSSTKDNLHGSSKGFAGVSYCVRCNSELNGSSSNNDQELSGCEIVQTPIQPDCCPLASTNGSGSTLCGSEWSQTTCSASKVLTTEMSKGVTITSKHPVVGSGHALEIRIPRGSGNQLSNVVHKFDITNDSRTWKKVKLVFHIDRPRRHTGAMGILRDATTQEPTGIHVQMSKNWHVNRDALYDGYWWTGVANVRVPPGKTSLELVVAYQYYKELHGVSHSQLSLLGWGVNGLWEEVGIGANGESITYEPHGHHRRQMILDTRPWLVCQMNAAGCAGSPDNTQWTENVGGGDFLNAVDKRGNYQYLVGDTSYHTMNGPRLTNATFTGTTQDQNIAVSRTVSTWTADDFVRHLHSFRYTFLKETAGDYYPRFAMYTLGGDNYNYIKFPLFAYGMGSINEIEQSGNSAVVPIKDVISGVSDFKYTDYYQVDAPIGCSQGDNDSCWFAMLTNPSTQVHFRGNRGIIVRNFHGRLNGEAWPPADREVSPFAFHMIKSRQSGAAKDTVSIELALPSEFKAAVAAGQARFQAGDYMAADIELLVPPRQTGDYFGNSEILGRWLTEASVDSNYANGWKIIAREAEAGDAIRTSVFEGSLERRYHPRVHVDCSTDEALFNIAIPDEVPGILPITIAGVSAFDSFSENLLDRPAGKLWRYIESSASWKPVGTNGSYQLEKDVLDNSYTYVYSLRLEFETNPVGNCEQFAFGVNPPIVANPPCDYNE
mmetsp:Transcript_7429/g.14559  ORF Transcript_7429/g.14559 Transcript_7429/m.14559 type:complete len:1176 (+) Transcript_7429:1746-5273(+)